MTFVKGVSGNANGRPPEEESLTWLMKEFLEKPCVDSKEKKTNKQIFIEKVYKKAVKEGDASSIKLIWNYIDGLPKAALDLTSNGGAFEFIVKTIHETDTASV